MGCTLSILSMCLILTLFAGCNDMKNVPNAQKCLEDYIESKFSVSYANYSQAEILRQQLFETDKRFVADVKFTGEDTYAKYECTSTLRYNFYDDIGWVLDDSITNTRSTKCFKGRSMEELKADISNNYVQYIPDCLEIEVIQAETVTPQNTQTVAVNCVKRNGKVVSTYTDKKLEFVYSDGKWSFVKSRGGVATNFYLDLAGTKWLCETDYSGKRWGKNINIVSVSNDSREIVFQYGETNYTAVFSGEYKDFESSHVTYTVKDDVFLGVRGGLYKQNVYLTEIRFPTFSGTGNRSIIVDGIMREWNGYDPTCSWFYDIAKED